MSETKQTPEKWKTEVSREARKERLAAMKSKDGGKKPIRMNNPVVRLVVVIVLVVALITTGAWYAVRTGVPTRLLTAATIGDVKIKGTEVNFYYHSLCNQYQIDPTTEEGKAMLNDESGMEGFETLADYIKDSAVQEAQNVVMLSSKAKESGLTLSDDDRKIISDYFSEAELQATTQGDTLDGLLSQVFGKGMNKAELEKILERILLANQFSQKTVDDMTFTAEELNAHYEANKDDYDVAQYRQFFMAAEYADDATDEEKAEAMKTAKEKAEKMMAEVTDDETFKAAAIAYAPEDSKETYETGDPTLFKNVNKDTVSTDEASEWVFDDVRKTGDKLVTEAYTGYYVLMFQSKSRPDYHQVSIRHILVDADREKGTAEEIAEAKGKADQLLADYLAGEQTPEAFGKLATEHSSDPGSIDTGGLYEFVSPGDMVEEFDAWCFAPERKPGDTGIVQTDFGFHVMYFEKSNGVDWEIKVSDTLKNDRYNTFVTEETAKYPYSLSKLGMLFVG